MFLSDRFVSTPVCRSCYQLKEIIEKVDSQQYLQLQRKGKVASHTMTETFIRREPSRIEVPRKQEFSLQFLACLKTEENGRRTHSKNESLCS